MLQSNDSGGRKVNPAKVAAAYKKAQTQRTWASFSNPVASRPRTGATVLAEGLKRRNPRWPK